MAFMNVRALAPITALAWLALAGVAHGQTEQSPVDIRVLLGSGNTYRESSEQDRIDFFNYAHCQCAHEELLPNDPESSGIFKVELRLLDLSYQFASDDAKLVVGTNCDSEELTSRKCVEIDTIADVALDLRSAPEYSIRSSDLMFPAVDGCDQKAGTSNVWLTFDAENDGLIDASITADYPFDAEPPPLPKNIRATPGEDAINVRWDPLESQQSEVYGFQVLCGRADGAPAFASPKDDPEYDTPFLLCGSTAPLDLFPDPGTTPGVDAGPGEEPDAGADTDAGVPPDGNTVRATDLPDWMANLDERYICGWAGSTEKSVRITGLENGVAYRVALLSVDDARNVVARDLGEVTPQAVTDFWEDYHDQGGSADGGLCLVTSTFGDDNDMTQALRDFRDRTLAASAPGRMLIDAYYDYVAPLGAHADRSAAVRVAAAAILAPLAGLAAFWEYTSAPVKLLVLLGLVLLRRAWRRRRATPAAGAREPVMALRPALAAATLLAACAWAAPAAAQTDPYWEDFGTEVYVEPPEVAVSYWNAGIKIGPYTPDVDSEFMSSPGPYERMYGGAAIMGLIDVERFFLFPLGQIGVAGSLGFAQKTANAFTMCPATDPDCDTRADGDKTSFRLMPMSLGAVYRFTFFDDQWHVPVVPYARAGLSYYLWWITAPDGSVSEIEGDRALGGTLGWQGSLGLAIRAERLDPQSARSLRNDLGIEHAGFYGELMYADVGGFGAEGKLQVGALTWFGGVNFEF
jgi:hypothetical protein